MTAATSPAADQEGARARRRQGLRRRKRESRKRGKLRGLGIGNFLEVTAPPTKELADITFNADGTVTLATGTLDFGMGHATPFAQVLSQQLGIPFDEDQAPAGRQRPPADRRRQRRLEIAHASAAPPSSKPQPKSSRRARTLASHVLEASPSDIEFSHGRFVIAGTDRSISVMELAHSCATAASSCRRTRRNRSTSRTSATVPAPRLPERLPRRRSRGRSRNRRRRGGEIHLRQRLRRRRQSDDRRRSAAWRRGAGHRPGADGE